MGQAKVPCILITLSTPSFDGDKLAMQLHREHLDWSEQRIAGAVASELERQKNEALAQRKDFAFETNFSSDMVKNMIMEFKNAGYKISLCYFGLSSIKECFNRVSQRQAVVERIQNPRARCFTEEQVTVIERYKNEAERGGAQDLLLLLWRVVAKELEIKKALCRNALFFIKLYNVWGYYFTHFFSIVCDIPTLHCLMVKKIKTPNFTFLGVKLGVKFAIT